MRHSSPRWQPTEQPGVDGPAGQPDAGPQRQDPGSSGDGESRYRVAAPGQTASTDSTRGIDEAPFEVRIEFVRLDGPEGRALRRRQAQIMRKVLRWIAEHPDPDNQRTMSS
jgi:hypothetical protein